MEDIENMKPIERDQLYEAMYEAHFKGQLFNERAIELERDLTERMQAFFVEKTGGDQVNAFVDQFGFVHIRLPDEVSEKVLSDFMLDFHFNLAWIKKETTNDYRNVEEVQVTIYEYGFSSEVLLDGE